MPLTQFERLAALSVSTLRLRIDYLPRTEELLVSSARTGLELRGQDLHLVLLDESLTAPGADLLHRWAEAHLEAPHVPLAATAETWRVDWGMV